MPELPEVETTRRGLAPLINGRRIRRIAVHNPALRQQVERDALPVLENRLFTMPARRGKYLWLHTDHAQHSLLVHLGMSGSLRVNSADTPRKPHDHIEIFLDNASVLRLHDPRRFGLFALCDPTHPPAYLQKLGAEPLDADFTSAYLWQQLRGRSSTIKTRLMDQSVVVGVGNIYASEALFLAGIDPRRAARTLTPADAARLVDAVKTVLARAIAAGGTTLRDFLHSDGQPGYFQQTLNVYGQAGQPCPHCRAPLASAVIGGRSSVFCENCQK